MQIENSTHNLNYSPEDGKLILESKQFTQAKLVSHFDLTGKINSTKYHLRNDIQSIDAISPPEKVSTRFGELILGSFIITTKSGSIAVKLQLGLSNQFQFAVMRLSVTNLSDQVFYLDRITMIDSQQGDLKIGTIHPSDPRFFSNGWQSWSHTSAYKRGEKQAASFLGPFQNPMIINPGTPLLRKKNQFSSDMFALIGDRASQVGLLAGFLSQKAHFGSLQASISPDLWIKMWANGDNASLTPGKTMETDWAAVGFISLEEEEPCDDYFSAVANENQIRATTSVPVGWCSWYHYYQDINQEVIEANLNAIIDQQTELPMTLFQIDDGFEPYVGDWEEFTPGFPNGVKPIAEKITAAGLTPGLWLAPYIVHPKSNLVKHHPEWLLRNKRGKPVNAGFVWDAFTYALDITNPEVLQYTYDVVHRAVHDWGFQYLKLDFLYAAALKGIYHDPTLTRAQALRQGLESLRQAAGDAVMMLACGCPLGSALGLFEAMRISADVSGYWQPHFPPFSPILKNEPHMPAARNALQNILSRGPLHRHWWVNDPDCLLVRDDTDLDLPEVQSLATAIALTGGSILLSDDVPALSLDRKQIAQALLPVIDQRAIVLDWLDSKMPALLRVDLEGPGGDWHLLANFNWSDQPADFWFDPKKFNLPGDQTWWLREFWTGEIGQMDENSPFNFEQVPAHGVRVAASRCHQPETAQYLGSSLHISQGLELQEWQANQKEISLQLDLSKNSQGTVYFYIPWKPNSAVCNSKPLKLEQKNQHIYSLNIPHSKHQKIIIKE